MATSSTSNSERHDAAAHRPPVKAGVPWAFALALLIVVAVEVMLHARGARSLVVYASDNGQYQAVRDYIDLDGPAEVALVGSSQMREGVTMPRLIEDLRERAGDVRIANYAARGAKIDASDAIVRYLLKQPTPPKLIAVGISVRDIRKTRWEEKDKPEEDWPRLALYWTMADWWREFRTHGWRTTDVLPVVIRNYLGEAIYTLKYRETLAIEIAKKVEPALRRVYPDYRYDDPTEPNPILGEMTFQHLGNRGLRNLVESKLSPRRLRERADTYYFFKRPPDMAPEMVARLRSLAQQAENANTQLILVEMPVAPQLRELLKSSKMEAEFERQVAKAIADTKVRYIPITEQPFQPGNEHFSDLQHHNRPGAELFGDWLAGVIAESLQADAPATRSTAK